MSKVSKTEEKVYVLVHREKPQFTNQYFEYQNLYLGGAVLCGNLANAKRMTLDEAEKNLNLMHEPERWSIWSIKKDWVLDRISERHILRNEREKLKKRLRELEKLEENI